MIYAIGIDPGQKGGIAVISQDLSIAEAVRYPGDAVAAADQIREWIARYNPRMIAIEKVTAMPKQGVSSTFKFGTNYGTWIGIAAASGIPHIMVTPRSWQKAMLDAGTGQTKNRSLNMARRLFPGVDLRYKADDGKADALHLARYALTQIVLPKAA